MVHLKSYLASENISSEINCKLSAPLILRSVAEIVMEKAFKIKYRGTLGPEPQDDKSIRVLNRLVTWNRKGIELEADPRHAQEVIKALGLEGGSPVVTPGVPGQDDKMPRKGEIRIK